MKIYTVIPYFSNGNDVNIDYIKSFNVYGDAYIYVTCELDVEYYDIVENELNMSDFFSGGFQNSGESNTDGFNGFRG